MRARTRTLSSTKTAKATELQALFVKKKKKKQTNVKPLTKELIDYLEK
jgi:hypothetical protein